MSPPDQVAAEDHNAPPPLEVGIAIVGGGLGGLAIGVGLLERGFDAHIFEAAHELRTGSGTIISIAANGKRRASASRRAALRFLHRASLGFSVVHC
jgi:2-polyprenyl-6-methoxyphenol hydroxylase-like FAD-dependent oxidoreductase